MGVGAEDAVSAFKFLKFLPTRGLRLLYLHVMGWEACYHIQYASSPTCKFPHLPGAPELLYTANSKGPTILSQLRECKKSIKTMSPRELGFIGLGVMGYPMALNLLNRLETGTRLHVYDVSSQVLDKFKQEAPNLVSICSSARDVAERSVKSTDSTVIKTRD